MSSHHDLSHELPVAPAPWNLTGEGWMIPLHTPFSKSPIALPRGAYASLEAGTQADQSNGFHGGTGFVMLVRYKTSDVGPYDELIYVPGLFKRPASDLPDGEYYPAITRIYVSTDVSVYNGRKNWGIPKHRADFIFSHPDGQPHVTLVEVSLPADDTAGGTPQPIFRCTLGDSSLTPFTMPISTSWLDFPFINRMLQGYQATLYQPPLPPHEDDRARTATKETFLVKPSANGRSRLAWLAPAPSQSDIDWIGYGDGVHFPKFEPYSLRLNFHLTSFEMHFPIPLQV